MGVFVGVPVGTVGVRVLVLTLVPVLVGTCVAVPVAVGLGVVVTGVEVEVGTAWQRAGKAPATIFEAWPLLTKLPRL